MSYSFISRPSILIMATMTLAMNLFSISVLKATSLLEVESLGTSKEEQDPQEVKKLDISNQNLSEFDPSQYPNLEELNISYNQLESLDITKNPLVKLNCSNNRLKTLTLNSDNLGLWSLDCSKNGLPALSLEALTFLDKDQSDFSGQQIILPKNWTSLNLKTEFPQIILNQVKKNSSPDGIVFNSITGELTGIKPNSTFIYYYGVNRNDPDLMMDVTLSFTGEEDLTLIPPEEPVSKPEPDPLPPFTGGNTHTKDDSDLTVEVKEIPMHRLYNPNTGEHLYTADTNERNTLTKIGWNSEGIGWIAPETSSIPVYRLYNPITEGGDHHYTMDIKERDTLRVLGWKYEDVGWYSVNEKDQNAVPLYRQYNPNQYAANHNYTVDRNEHVTLIGLGWKDEGTAWYGLKSS